MTIITPGWPYATKAIFQHEWDTDHLNIWVTFCFSMNVLKKPPVYYWKCTVDGVAKAVTVSTWQDAWTLLLTVPNIAGLPDRVLVEYLYCSTELKTTWDKQWHPFGAILSLDITT